MSSSNAGNSPNAQGVLCRVTPVQPWWYTPRLANISKYCRSCVSGSRRVVEPKRMLLPCIGICWIPFTNVGAGRPATSSTVGATSITCENCERVSPMAVEPVGPVHDRAVARTAPVGSDLLRPLVRRVHRVGPTVGVVVVGRRRCRTRRRVTPSTRRSQCPGAIETHELVERAVDRAFGARALSPRM